MPGTCTASGELDTASASVFHDVLFDAIDSTADEVVIVDCSGVTSMDEVGYQVLVEATEYATRHGHIVAIRNMSQQCAMVISVCDSGNELHMLD